MSEPRAQLRRGAFLRKVRDNTQVGAPLVKADRSLEKPVQQRGNRLRANTQAPAQRSAQRLARRRPAQGSVVAKPRLPAGDSSRPRQRSPSPQPRLGARDESASEIATEYRRPRNSPKPTTRRTPLKPASRRASRIRISEAAKRTSDALAQRPRYSLREIVQSPQAYQSNAKSAGVSELNNSPTAESDKSPITAETAKAPNAVETAKTLVEQTGNAPTAKEMGNAPAEETRNVLAPGLLGKAELGQSAVPRGRGEELPPRNLKQQLKGKNAIVFVKANWCGHCQAFEPEFAEIAQALKKKHGDNVYLFKVDGGSDTPASRAVRNLYAVQSFPTLLLFRGSDNQYTKFTGQRSQDAIEQQFLDWIKA